MANTTLTRPVVTMNLANRSIGRFGLLANRVLHPLVAGRFGREVGTLTQMSDIKITPSQTGITAQTEFGETSIELPLYAKLLGKAGISDMAFPQGIAANDIENVFRTITTKTRQKAEIILKNVAPHTKLNMASHTKTNHPTTIPFKFWEFYRINAPFKDLIERNWKYLKIMRAEIIPATLIWGISTSSLGTASALLASILPEKIAPIVMMIGFAAIPTITLSAMLLFIPLYACHQLFGIMTHHARLFSKYKEIKRGIKGLEKYQGSELNAFQKRKLGANYNQLLLGHQTLADIVKNPNTSEQFLELLSSANNCRVYDSIANNPKIKAMLEEASSTDNPEVLLTLSKKLFPCVRKAVARNISCPAQILEELYSDERSLSIPRFGLLSAIAQNPNAPISIVIDVLKMIKEDEESHEETFTIPADTSECPDHVFAPNSDRDRTVTETVIRSGYWHHSLDIARGILKAHADNRDNILAGLHKKNEELARALGYKNPNS